MATLARSVHIRDPKRHRDVVLRAGEEPAPEYAALIRNPDAWEGGKMPDADTGQADAQVSEGDSDKAAPAAKKTAAPKRAASKPARGRDAAGEGSSGA